MATQAQFTFDQAKHEYRLNESGLLVPSTTQVIRETNLANFDQIKAYILNRKRDLGLAVHKITEYIDTELADVPAHEVELAHIQPVLAQPRVAAWQQFKQDSGVQILGVEIQMVATLNGMPYGMTPDRVVRAYGREAVIDIKNSEQMSRWEGIQLASYDSGLPPCESQLHRDRYSVHLKADGTYRVFKFEDDLDYDVWAWALALAWWKLNNKYKFEDVENV